MDDRRSNPRVEPDPEEPIEVQITGHTRDSGTFIEILHARDISVGGIAIVVPSMFKRCNIISNVEFIITLFGDEPFMVRGNIIHQQWRGKDKGFYGVEFTEISEENRNKIKKYVESKLADSSE